MKRLSTLLGLIFAVCCTAFSQSAIPYIITMHDSYGDGWGGSRGSFIYVMQGNIPIDTLCVHRTGSHQDFLEVDTLWLLPDVAYDFYWHPGEDSQYNDECSFDIHHTQGQKICQCLSAQALPTEESFLTMNGDICQLPALNISYLNTDSIKICNNQAFHLIDDGYGSGAWNMDPEAMIVLYPETAAKRVQLQGTYTFEMDPFWNPVNHYLHLRVYDGFDTTGTLLFDRDEMENGDIPAVISQTGALTVYYKHFYNPGDGFDMEVSLTDPPVCQSPAMLALTDTTSNTMTFSWLSDSSATEWEMEYGPVGFTHGAGTTVAVNTNPFTLTSFPQGETLDFYVRTKCGENQYSVWSDRLQSITPGGFVYRLALQGSDTISSCGAHILNVEVSDWGNFNSTLVLLPEHSGQLVQLSGTYNLATEYDYVYATLSVFDGIGTDGPLLFQTTHDSLIGTMDVVESLSGPLTLRLTDHLRFDGGIDLHVHCSECLRPTPIRVDSVGPFSVTLSWSEQGAGVAWDVEYGPAGFEHGTGTILHVTDTTCTITGVGIGSLKDFYVRSSCGQGETSSWSDPVTYFSAPNTSSTFTVSLDRVSAARICDGTIQFEGDLGDNLLTLFPKSANSFVTIENTQTDCLEFFDGRDTTGVRLNPSPDGIVSESGPLTIRALCIPNNSVALSVSCNACPTPDSVHIESVAGDSITLAWASHSGVDSWEVTFCPNGVHPSLGTSDTVTEPHITIPNLPAGNTYSFYVRALCGSEGSVWWPEPVVYTPNPNLYNMTQTSDIVGMCGGQVNYQLGWDAPIRSVTLMPVHEGELVQLQGTIHQEYAYWDHWLVVYDGVGTEGTVLYQSQKFLSGWITPYSQNILVQSISGPLTIVAYDPQFLPWFYDSLPDNHFSMTVSCTDCARPIDLSMDQFTVNSVTLSWTETGDAQSWDIEYGPAGFTPGAGAGTMVHTTQNPYTVQPFDSAGTYDFYVRSHCNATNQSLFVGPLTHRFLPDGFVFPKEGQYDVTMCGGHLYDDGGPDGLYSNDCQVEVTLWPEMAGQYIQLSGTSNIHLWNSLRMYDGDSTDGLLLYEQHDGVFVPSDYVTDTLPKLVSSNGPLTIQMISGDDGGWGNTNGFDFEVQCITCKPPVNLTATAASDTSISLTWADLTPAESWEVEYGPVGFNLGTGTSAVVSTNHFSVQDLTQHQSYAFYVRSQCDSGDVSDYSEPFYLLKGDNAYHIPPAGKYAVILCGGHLYDEDVPDNSFVHQHAIVTLFPETQGEFVQLSGSRFFYQPDLIRVFDGVDTNGLKICEFEGDDNNIFTPYDETIPVLRSLTGPLTLDMSVYQWNEVSYLGFDFEVECVDSCPVAMNAAFSDITDSTFTLSWLAGDFDVEWEIEYVLHDIIHGNGSKIHTYAHSHTYRWNDIPYGGLAVDFYVHPQCDVQDELWVGPLTIQIPGAYLFPTQGHDSLSICGGHLYDPAGPEELFCEHSEATTLTLYPDMPGHYVQVQGSFYTYGNDEIRIYDGADTNGVLLLEHPRADGTFPTIQSISGPLTIQIVPVAGYQHLCYDLDMSVFCSSCATPEDFIATTYQNGDVLLSWTGSDTSATYEVEYGYHGFVMGEGTRVPVTGDSLLLQGLDNLPYDFYIRTMCADSALSIWAGPASVTVGQFNVLPGRTQTLQTCFEHVSFDNQGETTLVIESGETGSNVQLWGFYTLHNSSNIRIYDGLDTTANIIYEKQYINDGYSSDFNSWLFIESTSGILTVYLEDNVGINFDIRCITCRRPIDFSIIDAHDSIVTLSWTERDYATAWNIEYREYAGNGDFLKDTLLTVYSPTFTHPTCLPGHLFHFRVQSVCGENDNSEWTNELVYIVPPILYPDNYQFGSIVHGSGNVHLNMCDGHILGPYNFNNPSNMHYEVTIFPTTPNSLVRLDGYLNSSLGAVSFLPAPDYLKIYDGIGTDGTLLFYNYPVTSGLVSVQSSTGPLTIQMFNYYYYVNDPPFDFTVSCIPAPSCFVPTALNIESFQDTAVVLSWVENGTAERWEIEYGEEGFLHGGGTSLVVTTNPYTLQNLIPGTSYDVYVRSLCDTDNASPWADSITFVPNAYVVNQSGTDTLVLCGGHLYDEGGVAGRHHAADIDNVIVLMPDEPGHFVKLEGWSNLNEIFRIYDGIGTEGRLLATAEAGKVLSVQSSTGPITLHVTRSFEEGELYRAFDLAVSCVSCVVPKHLHVKDDQYWSNDITLEWEEGGSASAWDVQYGPAGYRLGTGAIVSTPNEPFTLPLSSGVDYEFYVRANCGGDNTSAWAGPVYAMPQAYYIPNFGRRSITVCDGVIYDDGGPNRSFTENGDAAVTLNPLEPGLGVRVFGFWYPNDNNQYFPNDYLLIYDGKDTMGVPLYDSRVHENPIMVTSSVGPLTLYLRSIHPVNQAYYIRGFALQTSCVEGDYGQSCEPPAFITVSDITANSATVDWVQLGPDPDFWVIRYTNATNWQTTYTSSHPYTLENLEPHTTYRVQVEAHCDDGYHSDDAEEITFYLSPDGVQEHDPASGLTVYPNPTSNIVNVECIMQNEEWSEVELHLCDAYGRLLGVVETQNYASRQTARIDLSRYADGVYFVKAVAGDKTVAVRKVVKG